MSTSRPLAGAGWGAALIAATLLALAGCSKSSSSPTTQTRTIDANTSVASTFNLGLYPGESASELTRDTSSCQSDRANLGLSGNWLDFSCNVVLDVVDASKNPVPSYDSATYVKVTAYDLPDYDSHYYPTSGTYSFTANGYTVTGNYSDLNNSSFTPDMRDPNTISQRTLTMYIPVSPDTTTTTMSLGAVGIAVNGVPIYDSVANATDNIFAEAYSFDKEQGHPASHSDYHYHSEPYSISHDDNHLIGVMRDGYFVYGRIDGDGSDVSTNGGAEWTSADGDMYTYGGHVSVPPGGVTAVFHYNVTQWTACYDRTNSASPTVYSDDGYTDTSNPANSCTVNGTGSAKTVTADWLIGHGNGGVFATIPTAADNSGSMLNSTVAARYYYGTPGPCTGCP